MTYRFGNTLLAPLPSMNIRRDDDDRRDDDLLAIPDAEWRRQVAADKARMGARLAELRLKDEWRTLERHKREAAVLRRRG